VLGVSREWHGFKTKAAARPVSVGSLLRLSVRQPAVHGGDQGKIKPSRCQCRAARSKAALPKAAALLRQGYAGQAG